MKIPMKATAERAPDQAACRKEGRMVPSHVPRVHTTMATNHAAPATTAARWVWMLHGWLATRHTEPRDAQLADASGGDCHAEDSDDGDEHCALPPAPVKACSGCDGDDGRDSRDGKAQEGHVDVWPVPAVPRRIDQQADPCRLADHQAGGHDDVSEPTPPWCAASSPRRMPPPPGHQPCRPAVACRRRCPPRPTSPETDDEPRPSRQASVRESQGQ